MRKKDLFTGIGAYLMNNLKNLPAELNLPDLAWFDKQMGQFSSPEQFYAIPLPCILMEYQQFTWVTIGKNQQRGSGIIRFYIYFENYADSFTGGVNQELALRYFNFTDQVNLLLQGFSLPGMTNLERAGDNEDNAQDMIITSCVDYSTTITDETTDIQRNSVYVDPEVTVERLRKTTRPDRVTFIDGYQQ